nr:hypothetical protein [Tanacetum cinerariifolium]
MKRTCYASSAITYMRAPLESLSFVAPTANWGLDKRQRGLDLCLIGSLYCWQFIASKIKLSKLSMICMDILGTLTRFLFQDNFYQLAKRIQHENQRLLSNPYPLWSKRDVPSVGPTDYLSLPLIISQANNHQLVEGTAHPKVFITDSRECLAKIKVEDLVRSGIWFTSNKSPGRTIGGLLKKLDRVLSNFGFVERFLNANAQFLPFVVSDHSPSVLVIPSGVSVKPKPFKFANYLGNKAEFLPIVEMVRNLHVSSLLVCYLVIWVSAKPKPFKFANYLGNKAEFLPIVRMVKNLHVSSLLVCYLVIW